MALPRIPMKRWITIPIAVAVWSAACLLAFAEQKVLYEKASSFNSIVVTEDDDGLRTLWFKKDGARQSVVKPGDPDYLELPYARAIMAALTFCEKPERVLIVGLGGGTLPSFLHKHYPSMRIDVVDIDPDVVDVARRFFGFREDCALRTHVADGRRFIEECREPYDMILLDAYGPDSIPRHLATLEFLQAVRRALAPGGIVAGNVWSPSSNQLYESMVRTYHEAFDELYILEARGSGNHILLALPREARFQLDDLARRASSISEEGQFGFDLGQIITDGCRHDQRESPDGAVLRDSALD